MPQINFTIKENLLNRLDLIASRKSRSGRVVSRSALVANILEEYIEGAEAVNTEVEDLKKQLADKEADCVEHLTDKEAELTVLRTQLEEYTDQANAVSGLQNELETARTEIKTLEEKILIFTGLNNDLKADKENLQKQLELVTLRLPPPRVSFWARLFGSKKE
jgi:metal-responsive CopG/Arc/MetJ family transcriptional regulator